MKEINNIDSTVERALIVTPVPTIQHPIQLILEQAGWSAEGCDSYDRLGSIRDRPFRLIIVVVQEADSHSLPDTLQSLRPFTANERSFLIVVAMNPSIGDAIRSIRLGAMDYLAWPVAPSQLIEIAERIRKLTNFAATNGSRSISLNEPAQKSQSIDRVLIGCSSAMIELSKQIVRIARSGDLRVFITGETGTGKEVVARLIHEISGRTGQFMAVNCAATVESLLESDLFGHEKGAFTGAHTMKKGLWEEAANGTLFLDEITETSPSVQAKPLRVLQEGTIRRVGSTREIEVSARVIAASNRDLDQAVKDGQFRQDIYYRLGQVLRLPPLRERLEDVPILVDHFLQRSSREVVITPEAMDVLCAYDWPGNVRELESVIQRIIPFSGRFVFREDVLLHIKIEEAGNNTSWESLPALWDSIHAINRGEWPTMDELRDWYVRQAYCYLGKVSVVARRLGLDIRTVNAILRKEARQLE